MALKTCKECKKEVSSSAKTCPHCGVANPSGPNKQDTLKGCLFLVILAIGGAIWFGSGDKKDSDQTSTNTEQNSPAPQKNIVHYTAYQLFQAYDRNEVATDEEIKGSLINVTGRVTEVSKDFTDSIVISLQTPNEFMPARFDIEDSQKSVAARLTKGDKISITCEKMARVMGAPSGSDCTIDTENTHQQAPATSTVTKPTSTAAANKVTINCDTSKPECVMQKALAATWPDCKSNIERKAGTGYSWDQHGKVFSHIAYDNKTKALSVSGEDISAPRNGGTMVKLHYTCKVDVPNQRLISTDVY